MRKECSICAADPQVRAAVDSELQKETPTRAIAKQSGFSKSAIARHSKKCLVRNALSRHKQVVECDDFATQQTDGRYLLYSTGQMFDHEEDLPPGVPVIVTEFFDAPITNVPALDSGLPPVGKRNSKPQDETQSVAQPSESSTSVAIESAPEESQQPCIHKMVRITSSILRCCNCGHQQSIDATRQRYSGPPKN